MVELTYYLFKNQSERRLIMSTTKQSTTTLPFECDSCGEPFEEGVLIRARYVGTRSEIPERPMCFECAMAWPFAITDWEARADGTITLHHEMVIGEWEADS
jgi:hypothetical protein